MWVSEVCDCVIVDLNETFLVVLNPTFSGVVEELLIDNYIVCCSGPDPSLLRVVPVSVELLTGFKVRIIELALIDCKFLIEFFHVLNDFANINCLGT